MHHHRRVDANRVTTEQSSNTLASLRGTAPDKNREECTMRLPHRLIVGLGTLLIATLCAGAAAQAQAPAAGSNLPWDCHPCRLGSGRWKNLPISAAHRRASFSKAAPSM